MKTQAQNPAEIGFWLYLMSDAVLFAGLFATYVVMMPNTDGGPNGAALFDVWRAALNTGLLLTSTLTLGLSAICLRGVHWGRGAALLAITFALGAMFVALEVLEFRDLMAAGAGPSRSGFLSAYFTLVGTHGLHVTAGLFWMLIYTALLLREGPSPRVVENGARLAAFWHMIGIVWIGIYSIVYLPGLIQ